MCGMPSFFFSLELACLSARINKFAFFSETGVTVNSTSPIKGVISHMRLGECECHKLCLCLSYLPSGNITCAFYK